MTSPLPGEHEFDSPGLDKLRESAVDAIAWALIDNSMDTADRQPSEEAYGVAVEQARALLPTLVASPLPTDEDALYDVIFEVLESRLEDVIDLDLNVPADSAVFRILVGQVRDAVEGFRRSAVSTPDCEREAALAALNKAVALDGTCSEKERALHDAAVLARQALLPSVPVLSAVSAPPTITDELAVIFDEELGDLAVRIGKDRIREIAAAIDARVRAAFGGEA